MRWRRTLVLWWSIKLIPWWDRPLVPRQARWLTQPEEGRLSVKFS